MHYFVIREGVLVKIQWYNPISRILAQIVKKLFDSFICYILYLIRNLNFLFLLYFAGYYMYIDTSNPSNNLKLAELLSVIYVANGAQCTVS